MLALEGYIQDFRVPLEQESKELYSMIQETKARENKRKNLGLNIDLVQMHHDVEKMIISVDERREILEKS